MTEFKLQVMGKVQKMFLKMPADNPDLYTTRAVSSYSIPAARDELFQLQVGPEEAVGRKGNCSFEPSTNKCNTGTEETFLPPDSSLIALTTRQNRRKDDVRSRDNVTKERPAREGANGLCF